MSIFTRIEARLAQVAASQPATLTRDRNGATRWPAGNDQTGFEERRLDWQRDGMSLAIIIQPVFRAAGVDASRWYVRAVAWQYRDGRKATAEKTLLAAVPFAQVEAGLDDALAAALRYLALIQPKDLKVWGDS